MFRFRIMKCVQSQVGRLLTSPTNSPALTNGERRIANLLKTKFPNAKVIQVSDISGGCGAMYEISVESIEFKGKNTVQQHRMVNEALGSEIKDMHGLRVNTTVPD